MKVKGRQPSSGRRIKICEEIMKQFLTWLELKIYRQVLLMVAISVGLIIAGWAGETFGGARDLAAPIGHILRILWPIFGVFLFIKAVTRKPAPPAPPQR
jgi:hypothetical protein